MSSVYDLGQRILRPLRVAATAEAVRLGVRPGDRVLALADPAGFLSVLSCRAGANRVFVLGDGVARELARLVVADNGCQDRVELFAGAVGLVDLPEAVDVIIFPVDEILPHDGDRAHLAVEARRNYLAPGGRMIPRSDRVWIAPLDSPTLHAEQRAPWLQDWHGVDLRAGSRFAVNALQTIANIRGEEFPWEPRVACTIDYLADADGDFRGEIEWTAERPCSVHGLIAWRETELAEGVSFCGDPRAAEGGAAAYFPLDNPFALSAGETLQTRLQSTGSPDGAIWSWSLATSGGFRASHCTLFSRPNLVRQLFPQPMEDYA